MKETRVEVITVAIYRDVPLDDAERMHIKNGIEKALEGTFWKSSKGAARWEYETAGRLTDKLYG